MFTAPVKRNARRRAFTLLEITLAVAILAMMSLSIYRFVQSNLLTMRISAEESATDSRYAGFMNLLTSDWQSLPPGSAALTGEPFKFNDLPRDEIAWFSTAGPGLLTRYASGEFHVTLRARPMKGKSGQMEIGLSRSARGNAGSRDEDESWISLLENVRSLQIRYFDPRLNSWVERWTDTVTLPRLIKLVIGRPDRAVPWESIVALGRTPL